MQNTLINKPVLILLDLINDIVDEKGKLAVHGYPAFLKTHGVIEAVNTAIVKARAKQIPIIFVRVGFSPDYRECPDGSPLFGPAKKFGALGLGSWATEIHPSIQKRESDFLITKHRVSPFYATSLPAILHTLQADTLLLGGVATDLAVQTTARDAHDRDYRVVVLQDLCGAGDEDTHASTMHSLTKIALVAKSSEIPELN